MIISTAQLDLILHDSNVIVADTRSFQEYLQGHIPGAVHLDLFAFHWFDTTAKGIENFNGQMQNLFSFLGVTPEKKVVFYDSVSGMLAARGVWLSLYLSHQDAVMLDGGITKWSQENRQLETRTNGFEPSKFAGKPNADLITGFEYILKNQDNLKIIDARSAAEFAGDTIRAAQTGHIPNSINIDWNQNIASNGTLKDDDELSLIYDISKDAEIVTYCQGAYRAANTFFALKKLGFANVRLYLGSWGEWGNKLNLPVTK